MIQKQKRLGELLMDAGLISKDQLGKALQRQKSWGDRLGANLIATGAMSEDKLLLFLARNTGVGEIDLDATEISYDVANLITGRIAEQFNLIPVRVEEKNTLVVACADPTDLNALDQLAFITGQKIVPLVSSYSSIVRAINRYYATGYTRRVEDGGSDFERQSERKATAEDVESTLTEDPEIIIFDGNRRAVEPRRSIEPMPEAEPVETPVVEPEQTGVSLDEELGFDFGRPLLNYSREPVASKPVQSLHSSQFTNEQKMQALLHVLIRKGLVSEQEIDSELMRLWSLGELK